MALWGKNAGGPDAPARRPRPAAHIRVRPSLHGVQAPCILIWVGLVDVMPGFACCCQRSGSANAGIQNIREPSVGKWYCAIVTHVIFKLPLRTAAPSVHAVWI